MISRRLSEAACAIEEESVVPGRVLISTLSFSSGAKISIVNIHNYDISTGQLAVILQRVRGCLAYANNDHRPLAKGVILGGDFNFTPEGEGASRANEAGEQATPNQCADEKAWRPIIGPMAELFQGAPTRTGQRQGAFISSRLDRIYVNWGSSILHNLKAEVFTEERLLRKSGGGRRGE